MARAAGGEVGVSPPHLDPAGSGHELTGVAQLPHLEGEALTAHPHSSIHITLWVCLNIAVCVGGMGVPEHCCVCVWGMGVSEHCWVCGGYGCV